MTPQGLNELKELATEVSGLRNSAVELMERITDLSKYYEKVENLGAYDSLARATASLHIGVWRLDRAEKEIRAAHIFEKDQMDFLEGVKNKLHNYDEE